MAMVEPFLSVVEDGRVRNLLDPDSTIRVDPRSPRARRHSAHTWLKLPVVDDLARVMDATTLPTLLLGGDPQGARRRRTPRGPARSSCPPCAASWSGGPCSTLRTATWRPRWTSRPPSCTVASDEPARRSAARVRPPGTGTCAFGRPATGRGRRHRRGRPVVAAHQPPGGRAPGGRVRRTRERGRGARRRAARRLRRVESTEGDGTPTTSRSPAGSRLRRTDGRRLRPPRHAFRCASGRAGRVALCGAPRHQARQPRRFRHLTASEVPVELRGAGLASREVRGFGLPDVLDADSILVCEVITPAGNWSSWPPHKHDEERPGEETELEEIYYFETRSTDPRGTDPVGYQRVYGTAERPMDVLAEVRTGDVVLVPHGWHGPAIASARRRPLLPQRHGRPRPGAGLADLRRPGPRVGPRGLGRRGRRPPTSHWRHPMTTGPTSATVRLTVAQAVVRFLAQQWTERDGERAAALRRVPGHLRPRQRRRDRAGAARRTSCGRPPAGEPALPYVLGAQRAGDGAHGGRLRPAPRPALDVGRARPRSAPARRTCSPARRSRRSTGSRSCSCRPARSRPGWRPGAPGARAAACRRRHGQRRLPSALAVLRPGRPARAAAAALARRHAGAHRPRRDRRGHHLAAAGRAGRGVRLAGRAVRRARLARRPTAGGGPPGSQAAADAVRSARRPAGRGRRRRALLRRRGRAGGLREATGIPVAETQAGKGSLLHGHPQLDRRGRFHRHHGRQRAGARGRPRYRGGDPLVDFTTASRTAFRDSGVRFVNLNVARSTPASTRAARRRRRPRVLAALTSALDGYSVAEPPKRPGASLWREWDALVEAAYDPPPEVTDRLAGGC